MTLRTTKPSFAAIDLPEEIRARISSLIANRSEQEQQALISAAQWAVRAHHDQQRASGEPYYSHALAVAGILNELNLDYETLAAAILHDVVEDTKVTPQDDRGRIWSA